jgi:predicted nucleotidyltransferase
MNASTVDPQTLRAVRAFMAGVEGQYPARQAILFGSRARGTAHDESDADVAVLLDGAKAPFIKTKMALDDIAYEVLLATGIRIQPLPVWEEEWAHPELYSNPRLLQNIAREGIAL